MFYNNQDVKSFKRYQRRIDFEKLGSILAIGLSYHFGGLTVACVVGLIVVIYSLSEIEKLLNYQNFMKEKEIGLHSADNEMLLNVSD